MAKHYEIIDRTFSKEEKRTNLLKRIIFIAVIAGLIFLGRNAIKGYANFAGSFMKVNWLAFLIGLVFNGGIIIVFINCIASFMKSHPIHDYSKRVTTYDYGDDESYSPGVASYPSYESNEIDDVAEESFDDNSSYRVSSRESHDYWYWRNNPAFREWCRDYNVSIDDLDKSGLHVREQAIEEFENIYYC